jgi:hypothetical protein
MRKLFEITSEEKNRILNLHESATKRQYLTLEQISQSSISDIKPKTEVTPKFSKNVGGDFPFGAFESELVKNKLIELKPEIEEFIKKNGAKKFVVNITSGESRVTNPKSFGPEGSLALARANSVKKYFQEIFPDLIKSGVLIIKTPKSVSDVIIGKTPYNKAAGDNKNPELIRKYKSEQFVNFDIQASGNIKSDEDTTVVKNLCTLDINMDKGQGNPKNNYITSNEKLQGEGNIELNTGQIPDRTIILDKKNNLLKDFGYFTTQEHENQYFKYIPLYVYQLTKLNGDVSVSGNKLITTKVKSFNELINQLLKTPSVIPSQNQMIKSGQKELYEGYENLKLLFDKGVRTFVLYEILNEPLIIPFSTKKGDYNVVVYSPVGQTGYNIKGMCY